MRIRERKPEDIEDVSAKYQVYLGVEYEADTIKKVYIRDKDGCVSQEIFVISLIEHKSNVDYDVSMQLLRYMCAIWQDYKAEQEKLCKNCSKSKNFRYPIVIPIVYYEGKRQWTADLNLKKRIGFSDEKENFSVEETKAIVEEIGGNGMGILFENMEKMDIQAERKNTQRERERAEAAEHKFEQEKRKVEVEKQRADIAEQEVLRLRQELAKYQRN